MDDGAGGVAGAVRESEHLSALLSRLTYYGLMVDESTNAPVKTQLRPTPS